MTHERVLIYFGGFLSSYFGKCGVGSFLRNRGRIWFPHNKKFLTSFVDVRKYTWALESTLSPVYLQTSSTDTVPLVCSRISHLELSCCHWYSGTSAGIQVADLTLVIPGFLVNHLRIPLFHNLLFRADPDRVTVIVHNSHIVRK